MLLLFFLAACSGPGGTCRTSGDCAKGLGCRGPDDPNVCGIPPRRACGADRDCGGGSVCHSIADACSPSGYGSACNPKCTGAGCGPGFRCGVGGACEPVLCNEGTTCAAHKRCDVTAANATGPVYDRSAGCVIVTCAGDGDCTAGRACVNSFCQRGTGACQEIIAVP